MLGPYEVHHIATGLILLTALGLAAARYSTIRRHLWFAVALGAFVGTTGDQVVYYALPEVTDAAYAETASLLGACLVVSTYLALLAVSWRTKARPTRVEGADRQTR